MDYISNRIRDLRNKKGVTQRELASLINISSSSLAMYETNKRTPDYTTLQKLADYFNVTTDYLLGRTDNPTPPDTIASSLSDDPELAKFWHELKDREDLQMFFKQTKDMSPADIKKVMRVIKAIEDEEAEDDSL